MFMAVRTDNRNTAVDLLKAFAVFGVIVIHTCGSALTASLFSADWLSAVVYRSIVAASVPVFFMCSGALLLDPERDLPVRRLYARNLLRIVIALFFWAFFYKFFDLWLDGSLTSGAAVQAVKEAILFRHKYHLYFLQIIILVYVLLPVTRIFVRHATDKEWVYALAVWALLGILYPTVKGFWPFTLLSGTPKQWMLNQAYAAIGYTMLGRYLDRRPIPVRKSLLLCILGFACVLGGTILMSRRTGTLYTGFWEGMSVGVALMAAGIFCIGKHFAARGASKGFLFLSKASFCIYLIHVAILSVLQELGLTVQFAPAIISIPCLAVLNLALSCIIYLLLSRIPVIKRWLI